MLMPVLQTLVKKLNKDVFQRIDRHACREMLGTRLTRSPGQKKLVRTGSYKPFIKLDESKSSSSTAALGKTAEEKWI